MTRRPTTAIKMVAALLVMFASLFGLAATAPAQTYPPALSLTIDRPETSTCSEAIITGTGFLPNATVTLTASGRVIGVAQTDANGNFTFRWVVPNDWPLGPVTISATDGTNTLTVNTNIVAGCGTTNTSSGAGTAGSGSSGAGTTSGSGATSGSLVSTGSATTVLFVRIAVLLLSAGGILLLVVSRRQRRSQTA